IAESIEGKWFSKCGNKNISKRGTFWVYGRNRFNRQKMISILIPTYNYNVFPLVENLYQQCERENLEYEILVLDDASPNKKFKEENSKINKLENCSFQVLDENIGRSKIRNLLATRAKFDWLLFLDADTFPSNNNFIQNYLEVFSN